MMGGAKANMHQDDATSKLYSCTACPPGGSYKPYTRRQQLASLLSPAKSQPAHTNCQPAHAHSSHKRTVPMAPGPHSNRRGPQNKEASVSPLNTGSAICHANNDSSPHITADGLLKDNLDADPPVVPGLSPVTRQSFPRHRQELARQGLNA